MIVNYTTKTIITMIVNNITMIMVITIPPLFGQRFVVMGCSGRPLGGARLRRNYNNITHRGRRTLTTTFLRLLSFVGRKCRGRGVRDMGRLLNDPTGTPHDV
jgi:hypothetical protein